MPIVQLKFSLPPISVGQLKPKKRTDNTRCIPTGDFERKCRDEAVQEREGLFAGGDSSGFSAVEGADGVCGRGRGREGEFLVDYKVAPEGSCDGSVRWWKGGRTDGRTCEVNPEEAGRHCEEDQLSGVFLWRVGEEAEAVHGGDRAVMIITVRFGMGEGQGDGPDEEDAETAGRYWGGIRIV
jgi:hypothetical protein